MAELVDAYVSGAYFERSAGSSPVPGTTKEDSVRVFFLYPHRTTTRQFTSLFCNNLIFYCKKNKKG